MIQLKEFKRRARRRNKAEGVESVTLPRVCAYFLANDTSLLPYLAVSNLFFILLFAYLSLYQQLFFPIDQNQTKQVIDIQLVSRTDWADKKDILPLTQPKPSLGKRVSPIGETIFALKSASRKPLDAQDKNQHQQLTYAINCQQPVSTSNFNSTQQSKLNGDRPKIKPAESLSSQMDLEEVAPLAMAEVKDNEGDNSLEVWQNGGRSNRGFGAPSALADYLKELHKKLKRTWLPPPGPAHHIKVLFRLDTDGSIVSMKLVSSSGESDADKSALEAVEKAAPFGKLPKDYTNPFLDVAYIFNYSSDELNEVAPPKE